MLLVSLVQLGGGYLFGLPVGFVADSIGATLGATAAFILGRTVSLKTIVFSRSNSFNRRQQSAPTDSLPLST